MCQQELWKLDTASDQVTPIIPIITLTVNRACIRVSARAGRIAYFAAVCKLKCLKLRTLAMSTFLGKLFDLL